jgi:O-antigen ligase
MAGIFLSLYLATTLISMATMSLGLIFLVVASALLWRDRKLAWNAVTASRGFQRQWKLSLLLFACCALSLMVATFWPVTLGGFTLRIQWPEDLLKAWYLFLPFWVGAVFVSLDEQAQEQVLDRWLYAMLALSFIGVYQHYFGWPRPRPIPNDPDDHFHVTLFLGHHLAVGSIWIFPTFFALDRSMDTRDGIQRWIYRGIALIGFVTLFLTYARSVWAFVPVGLLVWALIRMPWKKAIALSLITVAALTLVWNLPNVRTRIGVGAMGVAEREGLWKANWEFFKLRPLTGLGFHRVSDFSGPYLLSLNPTQRDVFAGHAHNNALEMLAGTGVLGFLAWLTWCGGLWLNGLRAFKRHIAGSGIAGLLAAWVTFHLNGITQVNFWDGKVQHTLMWVTALGFCLRRRSVDKSASNT